MALSFMAIPWASAKLPRKRELNDSTARETGDAADVAVCNHSASSPAGSSAKIEHCLQIASHPFPLQQRSTRSSCERKSPVVVGANTNQIPTLGADAMRDRPDGFGITPISHSGNRMFQPLNASRMPSHLPSRLR